MHFDSPTVTMVRCEAEAEEPLLSTRGSAERTCENSREKNPWLGLFCTVMTESQSQVIHREQDRVSHSLATEKFKTKGLASGKGYLALLPHGGKQKARVEKRQERKLGIVTHACDPSTQEAEIEGASGCRASPRSAYTKIKTCIKKREREKEIGIFL